MLNTYSALKRMDAAVSPPAAYSKPHRRGFSAEVTAATADALGFKVTKDELAALAASEKARESGASYIAAHGRDKEKPAFLARLDHSAKVITAGERPEAQSRAEVAAEFRNNRHLGRRAAEAAAGEQVRAVRGILNRLADEIDANLDRLTSLAGAGLAKLLLDDPVELVKVYREHATTLRLFAAKLKVTPFFNYKQTLADFGLKIKE